MEIVFLYSKIGFADNFLKKKGRKFRGLQYYIVSVSIISVIIFPHFLQMLGSFRHQLISAQLRLSKYLHVLVSNRTSRPLRDCGLWAFLFTAPGRQPGKVGSLWDSHGLLSSDKKTVTFGL